MLLLIELTHWLIVFIVAGQVFPTHVGVKAGALTYPFCIVCGMVCVEHKEARGRPR